MLSNSKIKDLVIAGIPDDLKGEASKAYIIGQGSATDASGQRMALMRLNTKLLRARKKR